MFWCVFAVQMSTLCNGMRVYHVMTSMTIQMNWIMLKTNDLHYPRQARSIFQDHNSSSLCCLASHFWTAATLDNNKWTYTRVKLEKIKFHFYGRTYNGNCFSDWSGISADELSSARFLFSFHTFLMRRIPKHKGNVYVICIVQALTWNNAFFCFCLVRLNVVRMKI